MESIRAEKALQGLLDRTVSVEQSTDPEELRSLRQINAEKRTYKENFERLRTLKQDITNIQAMLEKRWAVMDSCTLLSTDGFFSFFH